MNLRAADLLPCPFCGELGEYREDEHTYWTGMRSTVISVSLHHWCPKSGGVLAAHMEVRGKTRADAVRQWNRRGDT